MTDFVFIDSGVGGIPYMTSLLQKAPDASCVYVADNANFPYGEKSHDEVVNCVVSVVQKICDKFEPRVIVLACNTISVNALETVRQKFSKVTFVGTVPAIKLAASVSKKKRIGLLATSSTCENPYNIELKNKFASDCELVMRADAELISFIEENGFTATQAELENAVRPAIEFFAEQNCDVIVLGCTHFLNIKDVFEKVALSVPEPVEGQGPWNCIKIVDSVDGVVRHTLDVGGVLGVQPLGQGVGRNEVRPKGDRSLRELSEFSSKTRAQASLYITGETNSSYKTICERYKINFGGKI